MGHRVGVAVVARRALVLVVRDAVLVFVGVGAAVAVGVLALGRLVVVAHVHRVHQAVAVRVRVGAAVTVHVRALGRLFGVALVFVVHQAVAVRVHVGAAVVVGVQAAVLGAIGVVAVLEAGQAVAVLVAAVDHRDVDVGGGGQVRAGTEAAGDGGERGLVAEDEAVGDGAVGLQRVEAPGQAVVLDDAGDADAADDDQRDPCHAVLGSHFSILRTVDARQKAPQSARNWARVWCARKQARNLLPESGRARDGRSFVSPHWGGLRLGRSALNVRNTSLVKSCAFP